MTTATETIINNAVNDAEVVHDAIPPHFSDVALAIRLVEQYGHQLQYVAAWGKWLIWDGTCWRFDDTLEAFDLARSVCRNAAAECNEPKVAVRIASAQTVAAIEKLAKADRHIAATVDQWDADPRLTHFPRYTALNATTHGLLTFSAGCANTSFLTGGNAHWIGCLAGVVSAQIFRELRRCLPRMICLSDRKKPMPG